MDNSISSMYNIQNETAPLGVTSATLESYPGPLPMQRALVRRCPGTNERMLPEKPKKVRFASWNVGSMTKRSLELEDVMRRRNIDIMCVQETKWKNTGNRARFLDLKTKAFRLFYHGTVQGKNGIGIILATEHVSNIISISKISDRLMSLRLVMRGEVWNIVSAYAPQIGCEQSEKDAFWNDFRTLLGGLPTQELLFVGGDLNGHVGQDNYDYEDCHGGRGFGARNDPGSEILELCKSFGLIVLNTMFIKEPRHLVTYCSGSHETQIDYHICPKFMKRRVKDCKVIIGEPLVSQHRLLLTEFFSGIDVGGTRKRPVVKKIKWYKLSKQGPKTKEFIGFAKEYLNDIIEAADEIDAQVMWGNLEEVIVPRAKELLGVSNGRHNINKETWWWSDEAKQATQRKKLAFEAWTKCSSSNIDEKARLAKEYKDAKTLTSRVVSQVQAAAVQDLYDELEKISDSTANRDQTIQVLRQGTVNDAATIYKIAAQRRRNAREIDSPRFINDSNGNLIVTDKGICNRWKEYCNELLNQSFPRNADPTITPHDLEVPDITLGQISEAVRQMKRNKAVGPDEVPTEFWKHMGDVGLLWLTILANKILRGDPMPQAWRESYLLPLFKGKGDTRDCNNYRSIKLMSHTMKIIERVFDNLLRQIVEIGNAQCGFVAGKSTIDAIQSLRILLEKHREAGTSLNAVFIDLEKAFDRTPRSLISVALRDQKVPETYVKVVEDMYRDSTTKVRCLAGTTEDFPITVGVHQGSVLSPLLFILVLDYLLKDCLSLTDVTALLFADDAVLISSNPQALQEALNEWNRALSGGGLRIHELKTEHLHCPFRDPSEPSPDFMLNGMVLGKCKKFKYLGSWVNQEATCDDDVNHRVSVGWSKWKENSGIFCDRKMPPKLKGKLYTTVVRPALSYGSPAWTMYKTYENKLTATEMKMLRMTAGVTKLDRIKSTRIRGSLGVKEPIVEKIHQHRVSWYGHVKRRTPENPVKHAMATNIPAEKRTKGRPKSTWMKQMNDKQNQLGLSEDTIQDRAAFRRVTRSMVNPTGGAAAKP